MKAYLLAFFALTLLSSFCPPKKKYSQKLDGLWARCVFDTKETKVKNNLEVEIHDVEWDYFWFDSKSQRGYLKYSNYTVMKMDTVRNLLAHDVVGLFSYDVRKDDIGNLLTMKVDSVYIEGIDSASMPQLYKFPKRLATSLENKEIYFYYKIVPDSNRYNIKSFQFINDATKTLDVYHPVGEKYDRW